MPILFCSLDLYLPYCHSLKEKRNVVRKTKDRLRARFNFSIAEIDSQNLWQRARIGAVSIGNDRLTLARIGEQFRRESERILGGDLADFDFEIFDHD